MRGGGRRKRQRKRPPLTLTLSPQAGRGDCIALAASSKSIKNGGPGVSPGREREG